ncbi:MAG: sulfotransferase family 2 domain-containing protein [Rhodobacteraceae bacterium]|nr:sulfotransferase family 2 domain-containing protein [Paracoccaceae bacterium]
MPIFKAGAKLVYYAHVPKCAGSSVNWYLSERFGDLAFSDRQHTRQPPQLRWSRSSPQHIDRASLERLFPAHFFDAVFTIVRHPVSRIVSAFHFQLDVEQSIPAQTEFSDWLADIRDRLDEDPFAFDNHVRPMTEIVPDGAQIFHVEHGLDGLVAWFDALTGAADAPRAIPRMNEQGQYTGNKAPKVVPSATDLQQIEALYAADFERFGYRIGDKSPLRPAPEISPTRIAERDAALKAMNSPLGRVRRKFSKIGF